MATSMAITVPNLPVMGVRTRTPGGLPVLFFLQMRQEVAGVGEVRLTGLRMSIPSMMILRVSAAIVVRKKCENVI